MKMTLKAALFISALLVFSSLHSQRLVILHTNDLHSRLNGFAPESAYSPLVPGDDNTNGGFARLMTLISQERQAAGEACLLLDAGDFLMGSLFHTMEQSTGFQLALMGEMGYDAVAVGNHEFDLGIPAFTDIIRASAARGVTPPLILSNASFSAKDTGDDLLEELFREGDLIMPYKVLERNGLTIGIFALLGEDAQDVAPRAQPIRFEKPHKAAASMVEMLRKEERADVIICLSHSGVWKNEDGSWGGEDVLLAERVPGIDVIISGHTHTHMSEPLLVNGTPIVQAGAYGAFLGKLEIEVEVRDEKVQFVRGGLIPVDDDILGDTRVIDLIDHQQRLVEEEVLRPAGLRYNDIVVENSFPLVMYEDETQASSNLGALVADATYAFVNQHSAPGADLSIVASGMLRDQMVAGMQSTADIFRILSLGDGPDGSPGFPLATVYVTGKELKGIMEVLYIAPSMSSNYQAYLGGIDVTFDPGKGFLRKIRSVRIRDGAGNWEDVDLSRRNDRLYAITADTYLLEFIGLIREVTKGLVRVTLKDAEGKPVTDITTQLVDIELDSEEVREAKEWLALHWYLGTFPDLDGNGIPDVPESYRRVVPAMHPAGVLPAGQERPQGTD